MKITQAQIEAAAQVLMKLDCQCLDWQSLAKAALTAAAEPTNAQIEALRPFAKAAYSAEIDEADNYSLAGSSARHCLTIGDLRKAVAALTAAAEVDPAMRDFVADTPISEPNDGWAAEVGECHPNPDIEAIRQGFTEPAPTVSKLLAENMRLRGELKSLRIRRRNTPTA